MAKYHIINNIMVALFSIILLANGNPIRFFQEKIFIKIYPNRIMEVRGIYYFKNTLNFPVSIIMRYPFPVDKHHDYPFYINIPNLYFEKKDNDIIMPLNFKPFECKKIKVIYKQKLKDKEARYILTTTQKWGKPLKKAYFKIEVPVFLKSINFSYKPDSFKIKGENKIFYINKNDFLPQKDIIIRWKE